MNNELCAKIVEISNFKLRSEKMPLSAEAKGNIIQAFDRTDKGHDIVSS